MTNNSIPQFPTYLRKMWSGTEVQNWIDENIAPAFAQQQYSSVVYDTSKYCLVPIEPDAEMQDLGAQALVQWDNGAVWPESWGTLYANQYRKDARSVYLAMISQFVKNDSR